MTEKEFVISVMGAFVGTLIASFFSNMILQAEAMPLILASTGASAVLIFSLPFSPVSGHGIWWVAIWSPHLQASPVICWCPMSCSRHPFPFPVRCC